MWTPTLLRHWFHQLEKVIIIRKAVVPFPGQCRKVLLTGLHLVLSTKTRRNWTILKEFEEVLVEENLILHKNTSKPHYFIQIKPAIERFILEAASSAGISVTEFDLPADLEKLKQISKTEQSKKDNRFKSLFKALKKAQVPQILTLAYWVEHLKNNPYSADLESLKRK